MLRGTRMLTERRAKIAPGPLYAHAERPQPEDSALFGARAHAAHTGGAYEQTTAHIRRLFHRTCARAHLSQSPTSPQHLTHCHSPPLPSKCFGATGGRTNMPRRLALLSLSFFDAAIACCPSRACNAACAATLPMFNCGSGSSKSPVTTCTTTPNT